VADVVAAGDVRQRFIASIAARNGFAALMRRQLARAAETARQINVGALVTPAITNRARRASVLIVSVTPEDVRTFRIRDAAESRFISYWRS
jgi:hypothetical protein